MPQRFSHDPDANLDYTVNWEDWLAESETIATSAWVVPTGIDQADPSNTSTAATIWISGGTAGTEYQLTNRITTSLGRTDDRSIFLRVTER